MGGSRRGCVDKEVRVQTIKRLNASTLYQYISLVRVQEMEEHVCAAHRPLKVTLETLIRCGE